MGFFSRLGTLLRSNINELINRAEDPEKMLNQALVDMKTQLVEAKKQVAVAIADEKRLKKQCEDELAKAAEWERKAMLAVKSGNDELARSALARKASHDESAGMFGQQWQQQKAAVEQLKEALRSLDNKIEEAKRKRNMLVSRQKRAQAQHMINSTLNNLQGVGSQDTFERMSERVTQLEAQAEAAAELGPASVNSTLEAQFKALEAGNVDDQLAELKAKMALGPSSNASEPRAISGNANAGANSAGASAPGTGEADASANGVGNQDWANTSDAPSAPSGLDSQLEELKRKLAAE